MLEVPRDMTIVKAGLESLIALDMPILNAEVAFPALDVAVVEWRILVVLICRDDQIVSIEVFHF